MPIWVTLRRNDSLTQSRGPRRLRTSHSLPERPNANDGFMTMTNPIHPSNAVEAAARGSPRAVIVGFVERIRLMSD